MAWQSGYTCIGYNTKYIKEDITSVQSLFDPKYSGHIGMMGIAVELGSRGAARDRRRSGRVDTR